MAAICSSKSMRAWHGRDYTFSKDASQSSGTREAMPGQQGWGSKRPRVDDLGGQGRRRTQHRTRTRACFCGFWRPSSAIHPARRVVRLAVLMRREEEAGLACWGPSAGQIGWTAGMTRREGGRLGVRVEHRVCDMAVAVVGDGEGEAGRAARCMERCQQCGRRSAIDCRHYLQCYCYCMLVDY